MGRYKYIALFILLFLLQNSLIAQKFLSNKIDSLIIYGINDLIIQKFTEAKEYFTELEKADTLNPYGKIYLAVLSISESFDRREQYDFDYITELLEDAIDIAEENYENNQHSTAALYPLALAEGYYAYLRGLNENWFSAISNGFDAIRNFNKALKMDSTFYEAYTAIGTFKYWKSRKGSFLPMISDERDIGVKYLELAVKKSRYSNYLAVNSLLWVYIDKKEFIKTIKLAKQTLLKYPKSRLFQWALARAYESVDVNKSIEVYKQLLDEYNEIQGLNGYQRIVLLHLIAQQYFKLHKNKLALNLCNEILNTKNLSDFVLDELGDRLERVAKLKNKILGKDN